MHAMHACLFYVYMYVCVGMYVFMYYGYMCMHYVCMYVGVYAYRNECMCVGMHIYFISIYTMSTYLYINKDILIVYFQYGPGLNFRLIFIPFITCVSEWIFNMNSAAHRCCL